MSSSASSTAPRPAPPSINARLSGVSASLDRRVNAVRGDIADIALAARVLAPHYVAPVIMRGMAPAATLHAAPDAASVCVSELLYGEDFAVFDRAGGWAWGQCASDRYVGWVRDTALRPADAAAGHIIGAPQALLFAAPSIKSAVVATLPLGARVDAELHDDFFHKVGQAFVHQRHLQPWPGDTVDLAQAFIGTAYRWGGRTRAGIDCSGLVQSVLMAHGTDCPRDSDQQLAAFPEVAFGDRRRGDLVGFPGHVGILLDAELLLHANAFHMTTLVEPLAAVVARLQPLHDKPISAVVRPPCGVPGPSL